MLNRRMARQQAFEFIFEKSFNNNDIEDILRNAGEAASKWCTICENGLKDAVIAFLRDGDLPNGLAQNPEMCIIYG